MSTWQIISGTGDTLRWEVALPELDAEPDDEPRDVSKSRLPSMADLLLQGCSKLLEQNEDGFDRTPMFKTGLGRSVPIKQSSITKAMSVLGGDCVTDIAQVKARDIRCDFSNSLFQTGSGKMVNVSSDGLARAKTLLGLHEDNYLGNFQGFPDARKLPSGDSRVGCQNISHLESREVVDHYETMDDAMFPRCMSICSADIGQDRMKNEAKPHLIQSRMHNSLPPPIKFHTAGGRSVSVSSDALRLAKNLIGDLELGTFLDMEDADDMGFSFSKKKEMVDTSLNNENDPLSSLSHQDMARSKLMCKSFVSPLRSSSKKMHTSVNSESIHSGTNLIGQFDAVGRDNVLRLNDKLTCQKQHLISAFDMLNSTGDNSSENGIGLRKNAVGKSLGRQLVDISNTIGTTSANNRQSTIGKRRILGTSVSPFKRPRSSNFSNPIKSNVSFAPNGSTTLSSDRSCSKGTVSVRYPFQSTRMCIKEYFVVPPSEKNMLESLSHHFRWIRPDNAEKYMFVDGSGIRCTGAEDFFHMLACSGASDQYASKEWVKNHYKWIIWKLACYETYYPTKCDGKFLTVPNVLEELKYRYEREVNHGHRSAIKRILEGDASPTSMMVLCISAISSNNDPISEVSSSTLGDAENLTATAAKVELTDGWYSVDAVLDVLLLKQLASGKLFVGQKLRIWGAGLCGWVGPVSPLEVSRTVNLVLHINGTYRAHWADRLGFCKGVGVPLAFKCIKSNGGAVLLTLVGIMRIYPVLYKERLNDGRSVVRSERMETKVMESYNQRRSAIVESIVLDFERGIKHAKTYNDGDSEEGAKILKILEKASEPEVLLAEMSPDQINSFTKYQEKMEAIRHSDMEKSIAKALENAGLDKREVNPFMRVRVVGLTSNTTEGKENPKVGLVTIWNPTEKQQNELAEGKAYSVAGLLPTAAVVDTDTIYLQARESTTWKPLSLQALHFKPFFTPRKSAELVKLGEVPLSSEFDIATFVVFVGEVYKVAHQKKQWVFVTDSSIPALCSEELSDCLLAICFCSPYVDDDSFVPFNRNLVGSTVGFCNLIKRAKDQINHLWIAEASENSTYFLSFEASYCSHLKDAAISAERWGKLSRLTTDKLREKVLFIIGDCKS